MADSLSRIHYIDYMKALAMILVIMGHVNFANGEVKAWIYSFHMPAFFFCSGLVLTDRAGKQSVFRQVITKRFKRLMIPYLLWALIYAKFTIPNLCKIVYGSYWSIVSSGSLSSLWFLPVMFIALLIYYALDKLKWFSHNWFKFFLAVVAIIIAYFMPHVKIGYPWSFNVALVAFAFILIGNLTIILTKKVSSNLSEHHLTGKTVLIIVILLMGFSTIVYPSIQPKPGFVLMANAYYGNMFYFVFVALCGSLMLLAISMLIDLCHPRNISWLSYIGQNTLCIFAVQKPIISCFKNLFKYVNTPLEVSLFITTIGVLSVSLVLCHLINKYIPVFAGKN